MEGRGVGCTSVVFVRMRVQEPLPAFSVMLWAQVGGDAPPPALFLDTWHRDLRAQPYVCPRFVFVSYIPICVFFPTGVVKTVTEFAAFVDCGVGRPTKRLRRDGKPMVMEEVDGFLAKEDIPEDAALSAQLVKTQDQTNIISQGKLDFVDVHCGG